MSAAGAESAPTIGGLPRWFFIPFAAAAAAAVAAILVLTVLRGRPGYDDEGYILLTLRGFVEGHAPYDEVYSQYGPAFFAVIGGLFRLTGAPLTMDVARLATAVIWVATSALIGFSAARLSRSREAGVVAFMLTAVCSPAALEAGLHPTHFVSLYAAAPKPRCRSLGTRARL